MNTPENAGLVYDFETLARLAKEHGDSFYLLDLDRFRANLLELRDAFRRIHPRTSLAYSYKTNYTPVLCRLADAAGCYAEVVSKLEYDLALQLGVDPTRVIFNGPAKTPTETAEALTAGAVVNVDSCEEIDAIEEIVRRGAPARMRVGVRCNFPLERGHYSRFGIAVERRILGDALARLRRLPGVELWGLHCHFSGQRSVSAFRRRAERLVEIVREHFPSGPVPTLDIGGGFFGKMPESLQKQFDRPIPTYHDYAGAVAEVVSAGFPGRDAPELVIEPGAAVVADVLDFVCRVAVVKQLGDRRVVITTGSVQNIKARSSPVNQPLRVVAPSARAASSEEPPADLTGYTCMEDDLLFSGHPGALRVGDFLILGNTGAYTTTFKPPFIRAAPPILSFHQSDGSFSLARRREEIDDILATYAC